MCRLPRIAAVVVAAFLASPATATLIGISAEAGPGVTVVSPDGRNPVRTFAPVVPRFGVWAENIAGDGSYFDLDMALLAGGALSGLTLVGVDIQPVQGLVYPGSFEDPTTRLEYAHMLRFTSGASVVDTPIPGLKVGAGFDFDIGIQQADSTALEVGEAYIAVGVGPTAMWKPHPRVRVYAGAYPGLVICNNKDFLTGWQLASHSTVLLAVLPRYLDVKASLLAEHRSFWDGKFDQPNNRGGGFTAVQATVGIVGHLGWIFGIDEEEASAEAARKANSAPSGPAS